MLCRQNQSRIIRECIDTCSDRYSDIFLEHFLIDCASSDGRTLAFLIDVMGEERIVFGSDYCGGLGALKKCLAAVDQQPSPDHVKSFTEKNSRRLLRI